MNTVQVVDPQGAAAMCLLREAALEARATYPESHPDGAPWPTNPPTPAGGVYLVGEASGQPVACGALRPLDAASSEVRRIFVLPSFRRTGWASRILAALEARAVDFGYRCLRLETGDRQPPAMALYASRGYLRIEPFGEHVGDPTSRCYEKRLDRPASTA